LLLFVGSTAVSAELEVEATVLPLPGRFHYEFSITNSSATDVILVSIVDAPLADPLIDSTLMGPAGFLTSYDANLGFVDFLEDVQLFASGTTTSGFSFESLAGPQSAALHSFEAFDANLELITGMVQTTVVPEPSNMAAWTVPVMLCLIRRRTRRRPAPDRLATAVNLGTKGELRSREKISMKRQHSDQLAVKYVLLIVTVIGTTLANCSGVRGSSHSDAPLVSLDPQTNITDVFAFVGTKYNDPSQGVLNVITHLQPVSDRFGDDALYSIHITNPTSGATAFRYDFHFSDANPVTLPGLQNPDTILSYGRGTTLGPIVSIGDGAQNYTQAYSVNRNGTTIGSNLLTPPPNVGLRTTPSYNDPFSGRAFSGATNFNELDSYTRQAIHDLPSGEAVFAGQREDGFFADYIGIFDLLDPRIVDNDGDLNDGLGQDGNGVDSFKGHNVMALAVQIPLESLSTVAGFPTVGVYASVSRQRIHLLSSDGKQVNSGPFVQVNRMGNPLFSDLFVPLGAKDLYNHTSPTTDPDLFASYAEEPELAELINVIFGTSLQESGRTDLASIYIPDVLRVDTSTGPVPLAGQSSFSRLSEIGGDTTSGIASGFPNGRRFGDDVVDIVLTELASGTLFGDNVAANDQVYHQVFPYSATPHSATVNTLIGPNALLLGNGLPENKVPEPSALLLGLMAFAALVPGVVRRHRKTAHGVNVQRFRQQSPQ
jgi:hypothetical protein